MTAIVIPTYNHARFLAHSIESCLNQTVPVDEIIVVDDGSIDDPGAVVARYPGVTLIRQDNRGLAAARNAGLAATKSEYVNFLDADDRLLPSAIELGIRSLEASPDAALSYGAYRFIDAAGRPTSAKLHIPTYGNPYMQFLRYGNFIGMHATVVYRRARVLAAGGFDESFRSCEDYDLFLRIAKNDRIVFHDDLAAEYRTHGHNMSQNRPFMLATALRALDQQMTGDVTPEVRQAIGEGRRFWTEYYASELAKDGLKRVFSRPRTAMTMMTQSFRMAPFAFVKLTGKRAARRVVRLLPKAVGRRLRGRFWAPRPGVVKFGDFGRTRPISDSFGYDRGSPIDRYYIENFLHQNAADIRGRVMEIGDNSYTMRFGGKSVVKSDVLHVDAGNPNATIIGDLSEPGVLPADAFDCIVLTQTLHLIFDMPKAVAALAQSLKPGGVLLLTVPGITPVDRGEWGHTWFWSLTEAALARLLAGSFDPRNISVATFGNVFAAVSFLQGLAQEEVPAAKLDVRDSAFPVVVAARVVKGP